VGPHAPRDVDDWSGDVSAGQVGLMDKVIFLDFDGVLNNAAHFAQWGIARTMADREEDDKSFDLACVAALNDLVARSGAKVVISSSWRCMFGLPTLRRILLRHGFIGDVIGETPQLYVKYDGDEKIRGHEIQAWLDAQERAPQAFVILDDYADMAHLLSRLVRTSFEHGLRAEHVEQALAILDRGAQ
jgi:hypothetical protein